MHKQLKLQQKINNFLAKAPFKLSDIPPLQLTGILCNEDFVSDDDNESIAVSEEDDGDDPLDNECDDGYSDEFDNNAGREVEIYPETFTLPLPSILCSNQCHHDLLMDLAQQELKIHKSQAKECLQQLCLALGLKTALFKNFIALARSQRMKTRAWKSVQKVEANVRKHTRQYKIICHALLQLKASNAEMKTIQDLKPEHLKISCDAIEENRVGQ